MTSYKGWEELKLNRESDQLTINFNVAPTQPVGAAVSEDSGSTLALFGGGLIPSGVRNFLSLI